VNIHTPIWIAEGAAGCRSAPERMKLTRGDLVPPDGVGRGMEGAHVADESLGHLCIGKSSGLRGVALN
jgi:hypothetical protein